MNDLFDDDFEEIIDHKDEFSTAADDMLFHEYKLWKDNIFALENNHGINQRYHIHNIKDISDDLCMTFDPDIINDNSILCPTTFLSQCPKYINKFELLKNDKYKLYTKCLYLYTPIFNVDGKHKKYIITSDDVDALSYIKLPDNLYKVSFNCNFDKLDTYHKFVKIFLNNYPNLWVYMHYCSSIEEIRKDYKTSLISVMMSDMNIDLQNFLYNGKVKLTYEFITDCFINKNNKI